MNERILKLAEQGISNVRFWKEEKDSYVVDQDELAKFAELIVRECAGIYDKIDNGNSHMGTDDYLEALHRTFFGVEQ